MISREEIVDILLRWQRCEITERDVHETMEAIWEAAEWPEMPQADDDSIVQEAVMKLDALNVEWITRDDIPAFLEFLATPPGLAIEGWKRWRLYWDAVDMSQREKRRG